MDSEDECRELVMGMVDPRSESYETAVFDMTKLLLSSRVSASAYMARGQVNDGSVHTRAVTSHKRKSKAPAEKVQKQIVYRTNRVGPRLGKV